MRLEDIVVVLSRPAEAGNVGAVCRAMKNMGLLRLRLAAPDFTLAGGPGGEQAEKPALASFLSGSCSMPEPAESPRCQTTLLSEAGFGYGGNLAIIRARAVHAGDVFERAETFDSLAPAVRDCSIVIGATRRRGRRRKQVTMTPVEIAGLLRDMPGKAALVFGNERTGLEEEELELCNLASHIPADDSFPSLNLSHAVMIYAYELYRNLSPKNEEAVKGQWVPMNQEKINTLVETLTGKLKAAGFYRKPGREEQERFLRDLCARSGMTLSEGEYFVNLMVKAEKLTQETG